MELIKIITMKKLLIIFVTAISNSAICQTYVITEPISGLTTVSTATLTTPLFFSGYPLESVISKYDTTILYKGFDTCKHNFVSEKKPLSATTCAVSHGITGCPADWINEKQICTICLKHIQVKEKRDVEQLKDEYTTALEKLNKIKN